MCSSAVGLTRLTPFVDQLQYPFVFIFQNHNMLSVQRMLIILDDRLKSTPLPPKEQVVSILSALCQMARGNRIIRKYLRQEVLPPLGRVGTTRPEEGNSIRNRLVKLMTVPLEHIKVEKLKESVNCKLIIIKHKKMITVVFCLETNARFINSYLPP